MHLLSTEGMKTIHGPPFVVAGVNFLRVGRNDVLVLLMPAVFKPSNLIKTKIDACQKACSLKEREGLGKIKRRERS